MLGGAYIRQRPPMYFTVLDNCCQLKITQPVATVYDCGASAWVLAKSGRRSIACAGSAYENRLPGCSRSLRSATSRCSSGPTVYKLPLLDHEGFSSGSAEAAYENRLPGCSRSLRSATSRC